MTKVVIRAESNAKKCDFGDVVKVVLSRVKTLGRLELDIKAGLPTNIYLLLLEFILNDFEKTN